MKGHGTSQQTNIASIATNSLRLQGLSSQHVGYGVQAYKGGTRFGSHPGGLMSLPSWEGSVCQPLLRACPLL